MIDDTLSWHNIERFTDYAILFHAHNYETQNNFTLFVCLTHLAIFLAENSHNGDSSSILCETIVGQNIWLECDLLFGYNTSISNVP